MPRVIFNFHDGPFGGSGGRGGGFRGRCDYRGKYVYGQPVQLFSLGRVEEEGDREVGGRGYCYSAAAG
ncbi:hypothetical protein FPOAC2_11501 [Fusarium poae]